MPATPQDLAVIIMAAGKGTRMKSAQHKVLHPVGGKAILGHLLDTVSALAPLKTLLVVGSGKEQIIAAYPDAETVTQAEQLGTGHAAQIAHAALKDFDGDLMILPGDVPFLPKAILSEMQALISKPENGLVILGFRPDDPAKYGRLVQETDGSIARIVEFKDASEQERAVTLCNSGMMVISGAHAGRWLNRLDNKNAAGEYYLTDLVAFARQDGVNVAFVEAEEDVVLGINSREDLAHAEEILQKRLRKAAMANGVTLQDPNTTYFCEDTVIGADVTIEPGVYFGPGVTVEAGATIKAYSHIEGATVRAGASIGPFARLRPGADIGRNAKVGNFVEIKKSTLGEGAKVSHLSYIGDATVGAAANIGAGTITCNYDGFLKYQTIIGEGAFIGSNSALVAPVQIGDGAIVGAGSVVTKGVDADSLAIARGKQRSVAGYAAKFRAQKIAEKAAKKK
ncbi:MAG: bifunctional N-acetylglucosamine-1-phosphate uridyltransferase/glucosamine-1-phosphate acetyltransferase [Kordiimonadales bacterium]|nr:MAG: bifunctional N-acetylglucosamine-1-phosphate uridyltransferase/glucosamine-1-phosphate acetyltransferase [Kordiimonadales bacterium]